MEAVKQWWKLLSEGGSRVSSSGGGGNGKDCHVVVTMKLMPIPKQE